MPEEPATETSLFGELPPTVWLFAAAVLIAAALVTQAVFPRYEFRMIGDDGHAMMIYDRWSGRFQRANYTEAGEPDLTRVLTPF